MAFCFRESDKKRKINSLDGKEYFIRKSAYGFGEQVTFYDKDGNEIENFIPTDILEGTDDIYEYEEEEKVVVEGLKVRAEFSFSEWFE